MKKVVVVFSGGQDSTTCLIHAIKKYEEIHCITFNYGQRHNLEVQIACKLAKYFKIFFHKVIDINFLKYLVISDLLKIGDIKSSLNYKELNSLPSTFVPGRNILFLTIASIYAYKIQANDIITGISETDFSGYPDCRENFFNSLNNTIKLGIENNINLLAPLMFLSKAEIWALSDYLNYFILIKNNTITCYNGIIGNGCKECNACILRENGLKKYLNNKKSIMQSMIKKYKNL